MADPQAIPPQDTAAAQPPATPAGQAIEAPASSSDHAPPQHLAAKCLALFVILAVISGWNLFCLTQAVPDIAEKLDTAEIALNPHQLGFVQASEWYTGSPAASAAPVALLLLLGVSTLLTRMWSLFSGVFFGLIVVMFLLFLYGWLVFAIPLIQVSNEMNQRNEQAPPADGRPDWR